MSRFDQTGDTFLLLAIRAMLPAQSVATLEKGETPYLLSKTSLRDSNARVGALYKQPPADVLRAHLHDPMSSTRLALMMTVAAEYLPRVKIPPLYINSDIGPSKDESPAIFMCTNYDCGAGDTVVLVAPGSPPLRFNCVSSAVLTWASMDARASDLYYAVADPGRLDPSSVFARICGERL